MGLCPNCSVLLTKSMSPNDSSIEWDGTPQGRDCSQMHDSWNSLVLSLRKACPVCWILWRHVRDSPFDSFEEGDRDGFSCIWVSAPSLSRPEKAFTDGEASKSFERWPTLMILEWKFCDGLCGDVALNPVTCPVVQADNTLLELSTPLAVGNGLSKIDPKDENTFPISQINKWVSSCSTQHEKCSNRASLAPAESGLVPTRLIYLGSPDSNRWSLVVTGGDTKYSKYVALSHRWTENVPKLDQDQISRLTDGDTDTVLPKHYQNALALCRAAQIEYVWIDSLCIYQDSDDDFQREASTMVSVYLHALFTISLCWSSPERGCLPKVDRRALHPVKLPSSKMDTTSISNREQVGLDKDTPISDDIYLMDTAEWRDSVVRAPVNRRGWVGTYFDEESPASNPRHPTGFPRKKSLVQNSLSGKRASLLGM